MRKMYILAILAILLVACTTGPTYYAKSESDSIKKNYNDQRIQALYNQNANLFKDIYNRYNTANVGLYEEGIGITILEDFNKEQLHYIMAYIRPREASFDGNTTKPEQRVVTILKDYVPKYIKTIKSNDLEKDDIEGLAFGIYWAVRDHSQCDTYGGHIEYLYIFFPKSAAQAYLNGNLSLAEAVDQSEVLTSLDLKPAQAIRPVF